MFIVIYIANNKHVLLNLQKIYDLYKLHRHICSTAYFDISSAVLSKYTKKI